MWVQERLDRGMANNEWMNWFPREVRVLEVSTSDHLPLYICLNRQVYRPRERRFRFENSWIKESDCRNIIHQCWNMEGLDDIVEKMVRCCAKLEEGGLLKELKAKMEVCRKDMRKFRSRRDSKGVLQYNRVRWEYLCLLEKQEIYWKQRAKQFWLREGDKNTRFFHKYASVRKENNSIKKIKDVHGEWQESDAAIQGVITDYFSELFKAGEVGEGLLEREKVCLVSEGQNIELMMPVVAEEMAVFAMYPEKSPGMDGLNPAFFQTYWNIVGENVVRFCQKFMETGELPRGINRTLICLIPKVKCPKQMSDFRPISLCNVLMRILSKVMTNRLKPCLKSIISENQSAFIEGRLLTDNALIAFEVNHYIHRKTQGKKGVAGLKIDVSKAYDRLEWSFVEKMLRKFGFHMEWVRRIMTCVTTVSYSFLRNGELFGEVNPQRGVRQGDPISPYLYIMCAEGLSAIIRNYEANGLLHGCKIARGAPSVSHLLFADDCYFFFRASKVEAAVMKAILNRYERISGQAVNFSKSSIVFSPNTSQTDREIVCASLQVVEVNKPGTYLGMPMSIGRNKNEVFGFLTDRVRSKLQGWVNKDISKAGKVTLLKSAAQTIPNFWMSIFLIPTGVCEGIERLMNGFWWGRGANGKGISWMAWDKLCAPKGCGGLGMKSLKSFNVAMLAKQGWRILKNENPLVSAIMKARYFPNSEFLEAEVGINPSFVWRSIVSAQEAIKAGCRRKIGNGTTTKVWNVQWLPDPENGCMTTSMPAQLQNITVDGFMDTGQNRWDLEVVRDICNDRDFNLIKRIPIPVEQKEDSWFWFRDDSGVFTVRSCYRWLTGEFVSNHASFWNRLWSLKVPGKIGNFLWRVCRGCLPTTNALAMKRVNVSVNCPWCHNEIETDGHVLFGCDFAKTVWLNSEVKHVVQIAPMETAFEVLSRCFAACSINQCVLIAMICWSIWNRRNKWVWERANGSFFGVLAAARNMLNDWREAQEGKKRNLTQSLNTTEKRWSKPADGWFKVNCDASGVVNGGVGIGCVIRDSQGGLWVLGAVEWMVAGV